MQDRLSIKRITLLALMASFSIILGYVESLIPFNFGIPGIKLGLCNLIVMIMFYADRLDFNIKDIFIVSIIRIITVGLLFGNMYGIIYSLCGGIVSLLVMYLFKRFSPLGFLGVSLIGGVTHNLSQLIVAVIIVNQLKVIYYAPVLLLSGSICGALIGILGGILAARIGKINLGNNNLE